MSDQDRGELVSLIEPLRRSEDSRHRSKLIDLALQLAQKSEGFRRSLPDSMVRSLAGLVRSKNCYYSNLIEGHNTHPIDIERALKEDYSADEGKRNLQLEAKAHIAVQKWIDEAGIEGPATTVEAIREIHRRFYADVPSELCWVKHPTTGELIEVLPEELRRDDMQVGQHICVSPGAIPRFLDRYE
ncbi:MAG: hypothetical protein V4441_10600 [Pseudomonadota bacterium]